MKRNLIWFLFGLGSNLQLIASLSMTELYVFIAAPLFVSRELEGLRRHGFIPIFVLSLLCTLGCACASYANETLPMFALRGMAIVCLIPCAIIVCHRMLVRNMNGFRWYLLGVAIGAVVNVFIFQSAVEVVQYAGGEYGSSAVAGIMSGTLFWIARLRNFLLYPSQAFPLQCPGLYSVLAPVGIAVFAMATTTSGRSVALGLFAYAALVLIGGKSRSHIRRRFCRQFGLWAGLALSAVVVANILYRNLANYGVLGEAAKEKYVQQTRGEKDAGLVKLLMGGRVGFFAGAYAALRHPIIGYGPWAVDEDGIYGDFLLRYGDTSDYEQYKSTLEFYKSRGVQTLNLIPTHSYIISFWVYYGVFGLLFWLYAIWVMIRYLKEDCYAIPQWYIWIAAGIPSVLWNVFFSPFGGRVAVVMVLSACLITRSVRKGCLQLPIEMEIEARKNDK